MLKNLWFYKGGLAYIVVTRDNQGLDCLLQSLYETTGTNGLTLFMQKTKNSGIKHAKHNLLSGDIRKSVVSITCKQFPSL